MEKQRQQDHATIERILDRKTVRGRVQYLVIWKGFGADSNTWETRMDLIADGYSNIIRKFEKARKKEDGYASSSEKERGRSPARRGRGRPRSTSKSRDTSRESSRGRKSERSESTSSRVSSRGRSKSRDSSVGDESTEFVGRMSGDATEDPVVRREVQITQKETVLVPASAETTNETKSALDNATSGAQKHWNKAKKETSKVVKRVPTDARLLSISAVFVVLVALAIHNLYLKKELVSADKVLTEVHTWMPFIAPVTALLAFLVQKEDRASAKWIAIALAWRSTAEILVLCGDDAMDYLYWFTTCFIIADVALIASFVDAFLKKEHDFAKVSLAVLAVGTLTLFGSDIWMVLTGMPGLDLRVGIMSASVMAIALSRLPTA